MIRWIGVPLGVLVLLAELLFVWVPAIQGRGDGLNLTAVGVMTLLGIALILASLIPGLVRLDTRTNGSVSFLLKAFGAGYFVGKVALGTARGVHRAVTRP